MTLVMLILKILGYLLLAAVGIILLSLGLLLFVPVRYTARGNVNAPEFNFDVRASWLLKLVRLRLSSEGLCIWVLFFKIPIDLDEDVQESEEDTPANYQHERRRSKNTEAPSQEERRSIFKNLREILKTITYYKNYPERNAIISATKELIVKLFKVLLPKYFRVEGEIGLDSPHQTGYLCSVIWLAQMPVRPNFDEKCIRLNVDVRGYLNLWSILWPLFKYAIKRPIWPITKRIIRKGDAK